MICGRCGSREADDARYCTACGNPLSYAPNGGSARATRGKEPYFPRRSGARIFPVVLLGIALVALACTALVLAFMLPGLSGSVLAPSDSGDTAMHLYSVPSPETETPLYTILTVYVWELSGYADNPGQTGGPSKDFGPDSFGGERVRYTFSDDGSTVTKVVESPDRSIRRETSTYEIISKNCCDVYSEEDDGYWRFCLATDGNLYAVLTADNGPQSDYAVFSPVSP